MNNNQRARSPFEGSAADRLRRMGLTKADGFLAHLERLSQTM